MLNFARDRDDIKADGAVPAYSRTRAVARDLARHPRLNGNEQRLALAIATASYGPMTAALAWTVHRLAEKAGRNA